MKEEVSDKQCFAYSKINFSYLHSPVLTQNVETQGTNVNTDIQFDGSALRNINCVKENMCEEKSSEPCKQKSTVNFTLNFFEKLTFLTPGYIHKRVLLVCGKFCVYSKWVIPSTFT